MEKQKKGVRLEHISKIYNDPKYADLQEVLSYELLNLDSNKKKPILLEIKDLYDNDKWIDLL